MRPPVTSQTAVQPFRSVRIDNDRINAILNQLDELSKEREGGTSDRYPYRLQTCVVCVQLNSGLTQAAHLVPTRDLGAKGLSFLHGGYLHTGTRCMIQLVTRHGRTVEVPAAVSRCSHVEANVHVVGVEFDHEIDVVDFCEAAVRTRFLVVDDDPQYLRLVTHHLRRLEVETESVNTGEIALKRVVSERYDVVLMDLELPGMDGYETIKKLRERGYAGAIVVVTALEGEEIQLKSRQAGADEFLPKPVEFTALARVLALVKPIDSTVDGDESMREMVREFVKSLTETIRNLEFAIVNKDFPGAAAQCRTIRGNAPSYGFATLAEAAAELEKRLLAGNTPEEEIAVWYHTLRRLCVRVRAPK